MQSIPVEPCRNAMQVVGGRLASRTITGSLEGHLSANFCRPVLKLLSDFSEPTVNNIIQGPQTPSKCGSHNTQGALVRPMPPTCRITLHGIFLETHPPFLVNARFFYSLGSGELSCNPLGKCNLWHGFRQFPRCISPSPSLPIFSPLCSFSPRWK